MMLSARNTGVSTAGGLQRTGLIRYSRGIVTILDRYCGTSRVSATAQR